MRSISVHPYLNIAITAARLAGKIITRHRDQLHKLTIFEKSANHLVTMVDKAARSHYRNPLQSLSKSQCSWQRIGGIIRVMNLPGLLIP